MKDGTDYAEMIEMPVSTCDVIFKPAKKRKKKNLKEQVIAKVNDGDTEADETQFEMKTVVTEKKPKFDFFKKKKKEEPEKYAETAENTEGEQVSDRKKKKFSFDIIYAEGVAIFLLVAAILLTNIFWEDSGINTIMKNAFGQSAVAADTRTYRSFNATAPSSELTAEIDGGIMTLNGTGAIYPVCDGTLVSAVKEGDTYTVTINHSDLFKTVVSGLNYIYAEIGNEVYKYIPIGYCDEGSVTVSMYNDGVLLTGYILENGNVVWES